MICERNFLFLRNIYSNIKDKEGKAQLLGHAQIQTTTDVYTHISEAKQKQDYVKLANYIENIG